MKNVKLPNIIPVPTPTPPGQSHVKISPMGRDVFLNSKIEEETARAKAREDEIEEEMSIISQGKLDKDLSILPQVNPSEMSITNIDKMSIYIYNNGTASYAKLNDIGFARIKDISEINKVANGDILLDMHN